MCVTTTENILWINTIFTAYLTCWNYWVNVGLLDMSAPTARVQCPGFVIRTNDVQTWCRVILGPESSPRSNIYNAIEAVMSHVTRHVVTRWPGCIAPGLSKPILQVLLKISL